MTTHDDRALVGEDELTAILAEHEGPPHAIANGAGASATRRSPRRSRRADLMAGAVAVVALLVGSGLGFGVGSSVTPSGSARPTGVGFGFLPARGWNVVQSGAVSPTTQGRALAANVALREGGTLASIPYSTLYSLPRNGILISATFGLRGDPGEDQGFPAMTLPLRVTDATPAPPLTRELAQYRLRAGVGGSNVDVRIYFGAPRPTAGQLAAAERQLQRLVVASEQVTIAARPSIASPDRPVTLFGTVDNAKANEQVEIQVRDCGHSSFRLVSSATTTSDGGWSIEFFPAITTTVRAVWNGRASPQVTVRQRALLRFVSKPFDRTRFEVSVVARAQFWRRKATIQRFDRRIGRWVRFRTVVLTDQEGAGTFVWTSGQFTARLPKGTLLRAVLPASQAAPCYAAGTSRPVRT